MTTLLTAVATLDGLKEVTAAALGPLGYIVRTDPGTVPYSDALPCVLIMERHDTLQIDFSGQKGTFPENPNEYSVTFLQERLTQAQMAVTHAIVALRLGTKTFKDIFLSQSVYALPDQSGTDRCLGAGDFISFDYDPLTGPFLTFFGQAFVGVTGMIQVVELLTPKRP